MTVPAVSPPPPGSYRRAGAIGALSTGAGTLVKASMQVISIITLARLLTPQDFGVMAMVFPIIGFAAVVQEAGLGLAVVQRGAISDRELSTMFWLNVALGLLLSLVFVAVAPLAAHFYGDSRVTSLTMASASLLMLAALATQPMAILNRKLKFGAMATIDAISITAGTALAVFVAWWTHSYWAIFLLNFGSAVTSCLLAWLFSGWRPGARSSMREVIDLVRFGGDVTLSNIASYFGRNFDNILIGRVWGATALGFYERAYKIVLLPILYVHMPLFRLVVPMLSQTRDDPARYRRIFMMAFQGSLLLAVPGVVLIAAATPLVVSIAMGPQWVESAPIFAWLALACLAQLAVGPLAMIFISQSRSRDAVRSSVATSLVNLLAFVIGIHWGAVGVAMAYALCEVARAPVMLWYATRSGPVSFADALGGTVPVVVGGIGCYVLLKALGGMIYGISPLLRALVLGTSAYAFMISLLVMFSATVRAFFCDLRNLVRKAAQPAPLLRSLPSDV
ncbi:MAG: lipopolysaccharide biosynthesis protein [Pseudomonadota bacterium]|nr:lipopolysaccharide biosynthesis protein [Pseudomonadota bacterium]